MQIGRVTNTRKTVGRTGATAKPARRPASTKKTSVPATKEVKLAAIAKKQSKTQLLAAIAEQTQLGKKDVSAVLSCLGSHARRHLMPRGSGEFVIHDLGIKIRRVEKPATKARKGRNPATGEEIMIKARPARRVIKAVALKGLKSLVT